MSNNRSPTPPNQQESSILCPICGYASLTYSGQCNCINTTQQQLINQTVDPMVVTQQFYIPTNSSSPSLSTPSEIQRFQHQSTRHFPQQSQDHLNHYFSTLLATAPTSTTNNNFDDDATDTTQIQDFQRVLYNIEQELIHLESILKNMQETNQIPTISYSIDPSNSQQHLSLLSNENQSNGNNNIITLQEEELLVKIQILTQLQHIYTQQLDQLIQKQQRMKNHNKSHLGRHTNTLGQYNTKKDKNNTNNDSTSKSNQNNTKSLFTFELNQYQPETQRYIIAGMTFALYSSIFLLHKYGLPSFPTYLFTSSSQTTSTTSTSTNDNDLGLNQSNSINNDQQQQQQQMSYLSSLWGLFSRSNENQNNTNNQDGYEQSSNQQFNSHNGQNVNNGWFSYLTSFLFIPTTSSISSGIDLSTTSTTTTSISNQKQSPQQLLPTMPIKTIQETIVMEQINNQDFDMDDATKRISLGEQVIASGEGVLDNVADDSYDKIINNE